ncbi:hypothetical protein HB848_14645 [Listeria rocourtiae]|uniref:hypothetical protein n=1 Tax=Listeria rocourtiae TaxID=647910 RepID=UPI001623E025|nr:hypothetical protein [Listeria rocourtiae]MBC1436576.1 hypothetical protein [Listeria rocourtiae]
MKQITWRTNICLVFLALTVLGMVPALFITNIIPIIILITVIALGIIFSFIALFSKTEKNSARLIIAVIFFSLLVLWIGAIIGLGTTGFYDN